MDKTMIFAAGLLLVAADAGAAIYKCNTPDGVEFSQSPCAKNAVRIDRAKSKTPATAADAAPAADTAAPPANLIEIGEVGSLGHGTKAEIVALLGEPAATYNKGRTEYWLYANAVRDLDEPERVFAEILVEDGRMFQINWLPEDVMRRSIESARGFAGWKPPASGGEKRFSVADTDVVGKSKREVTARFGEPDVKKVHAGAEWWEYHQVPLTPESPQTLTIYLEFDGDVVTNSVGN